MRKLNTYGPSLIVLGTAVFVLLAGPSAVWRLTYAQTQASVIQASQSLDNNPVLQKINQAYRDIATLVEPSVVHISTERTDRDSVGKRLITSSGSGWVYSDLGYVVTNNHVVQGADRIEVQLHTGITRDAVIVGSDPYTDIAVIKIDPVRLFPALRAQPPADGQSIVRQGDLVFAFGSPFDFRFSMSSGIVSGIGRSVGVIRDDHNRWKGYENFIQVDAAINPGNSGGPLTDARGHVIGMNTAIATSGSNRLDEGQFAGIGLAIPIEMIEPIVEQIINSGSVKKGFLGVGVVDRESTVANELSRIGFDGYGITVARVDPDNPAYEAGLALGDVITGINGKVVRTVADLETIARDIEPKDTAVLSVWRYDTDGGAPEELQIRLPGVVAANGFRGVWLLELNDQITDWLAVLGFSGRGVRIVTLEPGEPAREAGLRPRDIITHVNGSPIASLAQLGSEISTIMPGDVARVTVWRYAPQSGRGHVTTHNVQLSRLDEMAIMGRIPTDQHDISLRRLGLARIATNTPRLADKFGIEFRPGVLVAAVVPGSTLDGRIEPGSVIVAVMDRRVADEDEFFAMLERYDLRPQYGVRITYITPRGRRLNTHLALE